MNIPSEPARGASLTTELAVEGMTCSHCASRVAAALQQVEGVASAGTLLEGGRATVRWKPGATPDSGRLLQAVRQAGFLARPATEAAAATGAGASHHDAWRRNVWLGLACTLPLLLGDWLLGCHGERWFHWLGFALALPVQVRAGARFYRGAWNQLKVGQSNMDTLVALGSTTAFAYSVWGLFSGRAQHLYFMEAAAIITLVSLGHWLEARAGAKVDQALRSLLRLAPATARLRRPGGQESTVPLSALLPGDEVLLRPGESVPVDGDVLEGQSALDESMLTGESLPVEKAPGQPLYAGTLNRNGHLVLRVTATGENTALARIIAAVQRAQNSRASIQRLADRVSSVFVPVVVLVAAATAAFWGFWPETARAVQQFLAPAGWMMHAPESALAGALIHAAAVLIVACPCALGLATPVAIMAATNAALARGILVRDGVALEKAGRITTVIFDKTGTLTVGRPELVGLEVCAGVLPEGTVRRGAAALARRSRHPLSQALAALATEEMSLADWQEIRGGGLEARAAHPEDASRREMLRLGALTWLETQGVAGAAQHPAAQRGLAQGATVLGLAWGRQLAAVFALRDTLKPQAAEVIRQLEARGLTCHLVTGDNRPTAVAMARLAGIPDDRVLAAVGPEEKARCVRRLQESGHRVAFVGDGINDAPALAQADLGIAVAQASDVAAAAADIILLRADIQAVPELLGLARASLGVIRQNLFWAFFYNIAGIPLAALGLLNPVFCALAMGLSDLFVIGNALRLRRWKERAIGSR